MNFIVGFNFFATISICLLNNINKFVVGQFIQPGLCELQCHCPKGENVVHCDRQDRLLGVPTNIPPGVTKLYIQQSHFPAPNYLRRTNMTGLHELEYLHIIYCNLQVIESKTFIEMTKLKHLDLSHNAILRLESYTFYGLQLMNLYLNEQNLQLEQSLFISEDAFHGLAVSQINLRGNHLSSIIFETFAKIPNLDRLILSDNMISQLDDDFEKYFNSPTRLLDLTSNPLECHCRLAWIATRIAQWTNTIPGLNMTCIYYPNYNKQLREQTPLVYELNKLSTDNLCPTSRIKQIWVNVFEDTTKALISCTAETIPKQVTTTGAKISAQASLLSAGFFSHTPPDVAWRYVEGGQLREVRRLTTSVSDHFNGNHLNSNVRLATATVELNVTLNTNPQKYTCATWDDKKQTEEVIVTLKGPKIALKHNKSWINPNESRNDINNIDNGNNRNSVVKLQERKFDDSKRTEVVFEKPHYLFQKQFTLLEMSGAVIGTFLATLVFLLIGAKCLHFFQHNSLFHLSSDCSSMIVTDSKGVYLAGKTLSNGQNNIHQHSMTPRKMNGFGSEVNENNTAMLNSHSPSQYPHLLLPGLSTHANMNQLPNMANKYLAVSGGLPLPSAPSSVAATDDLQSSLALLTSSPLIHPSNLRSLLSHNEANLSPFLRNPQQQQQQQQQQLVNWPIPPGSPYSVTGSHEYDIPRVVDLPASNLTISLGTMNRSSLINTSEQASFFGSNCSEAKLCQS